MAPGSSASARIPCCNTSDSSGHSGTSRNPASAPEGSASSPATALVANHHTATAPTVRKARIENHPMHRHVAQWSSILQGKNGNSRARHAQRVGLPGSDTPRRHVLTAPCLIRVGVMSSR